MLELKAKNGTLDFAQYVAQWTPETEPRPSADLMAALADEHKNDYLTCAVWGEAHHLNPDQAALFLAHCQQVRKQRDFGRDALKNYINPHR